MDRTISLTLDVLTILSNRNVPAVVVGAVAMAYRGFVRATSDLDLVVDLPTFPQMKELTEALNPLGQIEFRFGDAEDPLGALIDVQSADGGHVQVFSYRGTYESSPLFAQELQSGATEVAGMPRHFKVAPLLPLLASKIYAGVASAAFDVAELLKTQTSMTLAEVEAYCQRVGLKEDWDSMAPLLRSFTAP
jgi:hypothetical protein